MEDITEERKVLASLVVFSELYDKQRDVYGVIEEFLKEIIFINGKHRFNSTEITNLLNRTYGFTIPEAVVNTVLKRLNLSRNRGIYEVRNIQEYDRRRVGKLQEKSLIANAEIINNLISFVEIEKGCILTEEEKSKVVTSFCFFLLDDSNITEYSEYISGFVIRNMNNEGFKDSINKIREGVIIYSGISYCDLSTIGSWRTKLTIFLDTEILFHFAGYNGDLYKSLFEDFFNYVKEINNKAKSVLVRLEYFPEVKEEMESFFIKAEYIIEGKENQTKLTNAMTSILEGCKSPSDIQSKKADLYLKLRRSSIFESDPQNFYLEENQKFNIVDSSIISDLSKELSIDITEKIKFLNYVNISRKNLLSTNFENVGFILLTGDSVTVKIANHDLVKPESKVPLATTLNSITNRFWFKLNKGFGNGSFPLTFDVIAKAQMVLSSIINRSLGEKYSDLLNDFKTGQLSEETAKSRIIQLRNQVKKPEDIGLEDVSQILEALSEDSLEKFARDQEFAKNETQKQYEENIRLRKELETNKSLLSQQETDRINFERMLIEILEKDFSDKKNEFQNLEKLKVSIEEHAIRSFIGFKIGFGISIFLVTVIPILTKFYLKLDILSIFSLLFPVFGIFYALVTGKKWNWEIKNFLDNKLEKIKEAKNNEFHFDKGYFFKLQGDINLLEEKICQIKNNFHYTDN